MGRGLGDLEQLVVLAVLRLGEDAYAVAVRNEIESRTSRALSRGAVYVTLDRMERKGFLRSRLGGSTSERGGKAKRMFALEPKGYEALQFSLTGLRNMMSGMPEDLAWDHTS